jgi:hypothetical protein
MTTSGTHIASMKTAFDDNPLKACEVIHGDVFISELIEWREAAAGK